MTLNMMGLYLLCFSLGQLLFLLTIINDFPALKLARTNSIHVILQSIR